MNKPLVFLAGMVTANLIQFFLDGPDDLPRKAENLRSWLALIGLG